MISLAQDGFTDAQVRDALHGVTGEICAEVRFDLLRNGARTGTLDGTGFIAFDSAAAVMRTASLLLYGEADWFRDEIRPVLYLRVCTAKPVMAEIVPWDRFDALGLDVDAIDQSGALWSDIDQGRVSRRETETGWAKFPLGVFVPMRTRRIIDQSGQVRWQVACYDRSMRLRLDRLTEPLFLAQGTRYLDAVRGLLDGAGAGSVILGQGANPPIPADREFPFGTEKLEVINTLLKEINYDPLYCDAFGNYVIGPYADFSQRPVDYAYQSGDRSILCLEASSELDTLAVPNVFTAVCSNPDLPRDYLSVWVNDLPGSRLAVQRRNPSRVVQYPPTEVLMVGSQAELDAINERIGRDASRMGEERLDFTTSVMPFHGYRNLLRIEHPIASGRYVETSWRIDLSSMRMSHSARKAVAL